MDKQKRQVILKCLSIINNYINKALPPGTKRQRKGGVYEKQSNGQWVKIKGDGADKKKKEKPEELTAPRDLTQMTPKQNRQFVNSLKAKFSEQELNKRVKIIDAQIKRREGELESQGVDFRRKPDHGLNNLWHNRKLTETATQEIRDKKIK